MPMTEVHTYQLSTAENELGVVIAHSEEGKKTIVVHCFFTIVSNYNYSNNFTGVAMIPISWTQMQCPNSFSKEFRKVAKVVPEHVVAEQK